MKWEASLFSVPRLSKRFSGFSVFLFLGAFLLLGVLAGVLLPAFGAVFQGETFLPLFFSGIPSPKAGFFSCFSVFLLNLLIFLILLFLLGMTAFGIAAVPAVLLLKGFSLGIGLYSFLWKYGFAGLWTSACSYLPAAAASSVLLLFFGARALVFSHRLAKVGFSSEEGTLDLGDHFKDLLRFLALSVAVSLAASCLATLYAVFFL